MARYEAVIGLEVHVRLNTSSKLFCACSSAYGSAPNSRICSVCSGQPGALPVLNKKAVEYAVRAGLALNSSIRTDSVFARKNYFYPDLPNGYQISQFDLPLCEGGWLNISVQGKEKRIGLTRIHLENDAGKNIHEAGASYVDLNRAGSPLIEIVSEPDLRSAEEAEAYLRDLYSIVTFLGLCDGNMEEGSFRCDANVSIRPVGQKEFGTRTELKNLNSFRHVKRAIEYEIARQEDCLDEQKIIVQETRLYDSEKNITLSMRGKEEAHDYRYFPDPDLLPVYISAEELDVLRNSQPELPKERIKRLAKCFNLSEEDLHLLGTDRHLADFFEEACSFYERPRKILNLILGSLLREMNEHSASFKDCAMSAQNLAELAKIIDDGLISDKIGGDIFPALFVSGKSPKDYVQENNLVQISDHTAIEQIIDEILIKNPAEVLAFKGGKTKLMGFFVGQVMRKMQGKANPGIVNEILVKKLQS